MEILAIKHNSTGMGLSVNDEKQTDEWCAASTELTQFFSRKEAEGAMKKYGLHEKLFTIIPHPHQKPLKRKRNHEHLPSPAAPRFK